MVRRWRRETRVLITNQSRAEKSVRGRLLFRCLLSVASWLFLGYLCQASEATKSVLILFNERSDWEANVLVDRGIRSTLNQASNENIDIYSEYIGTWEVLRREDYRRALKDILRHKYEGKRFSVVIAVTEEPLLFLREQGRELFPDTPIITFGGNSVINEWRGGPPITGVLPKMDFRGKFELMLRL